MSWEVVIGLEVHVQLATRSKIFSGAATRFGAEPNRQACAIDLAMPGTLPVLNAEAMDMAVRFGLAIDAEIGRHSVFDRKNYFYPDLPKGYQISQMDQPIVGRGRLDVVLPDGGIKTVGITRAHLEEDAGKSLHEDFHGMSGIDLNRAGTPLLEIVSEPDLRGAGEAVAYLKQLHGLVRDLGISDGNMAEGSMRCDVNISLRPAGSDTLGTRTEIKNVNSFRFVERAIHYEMERQRDVLENGGDVVQETRLYDADANETRPMRSKEVAHDYRYFPEPDLLPVLIDEAYIEDARARLPMLRPARMARLVDEFGCSESDALQLSASREQTDYFVACAQASGSARLAGNWVMGDLAAALNRDGLDIDASPVSAEALGLLLARIEDGTISGKIAKLVFEKMWQGQGSADEIIVAEGLAQVSDSGAIEAMVDEVLASNAEQVEKYRATPPDKRRKMFGFFVGQVMKASGGKANPQQANEILRRKLD
jgi:aspartyl-tRNA(Asn)/glutamyl-tRNA(Gln) amidotransferase subunit B